VVDKISIQLRGTRYRPRNPGLDWTDKYQSVAMALANLNVRTSYLDGELCGVDESGLPSFAET
jgi:ATP-dependent DNA ligase